MEIKFKVTWMKVLIISLIIVYIYNLTIFIQSGIYEKIVIDFLESLIKYDVGEFGVVLNVYLMVIDMVFIYIFPLLLSSFLFEETKEQKEIKEVTKQIRKKYTLMRYEEKLKKLKGGLK
ncbi:MAG: hypothetical protein PHX47_02525 [Candidatus ainarchaeum sp.]|nr:hypothetical protein [Candidatus ainarchaeum sp.]